MRCAIDESELLVKEYDGYPIHHCSQCSGALISGTLLRDVRAYAALEMHKRRGNLPHGGACPADGTAMNALAYKGVAMSVCPLCFGLWLGAGDLAPLLAMVGPPKQADLSKIGQRLATLDRGAGALGRNDITELMQVSVDVLDGIGKVVD